MPYFKDEVLPERLYFLSQKDMEVTYYKLLGIDRPINKNRAIVDNYEKMMEAKAYGRTILLKLLKNDISIGELNYIDYNYYKCYITSYPEEAEAIKVKFTPTL